MTAYGMGRLDGTYFIEAKRLLEEPGYPWPWHMAGKIWVDIDEFTTAWLVAIVLHGRGHKADAEFIRQSFAKLPPARPPSPHVVFGAADQAGDALDSPAEALTRD